MLLKLSIQSYHRLSPRQQVTKYFDSKGGSIGRSEETDWQLPDPERVVSGLHASIEKREDGYYIEDRSTNGLFINHKIEPLGEGILHKLAEDDLLVLGDYEVKVSFSDASPEIEHTPFLAKSVTPESTPIVIPSSAGANLDVKPAIGSGFSLDDFNLESALEGHSHVSNLTSIPTESSTHTLSVSNSLDDHFLPPQPQIPDDWDTQWTSKSIEAESPSPVTKLAEVLDPKPSDNTTAIEESRALIAFLQGMGMSMQNIPKNANPQWWAQLGSTYRDLLMGLTTTLRARSETKAQFRVNQTLFRQAENNPLKFSATWDDVFHNLFNRPESSFLSPSEAIKEAYDDIRKHEEAMLSASHVVVSETLKKLSPKLIEINHQESGLLAKVNTAKRQSRYWHFYKSLYKDMQSEIQEQTSIGANVEFTKAYEASLRSEFKGDEHA
jgi:type VI secretion system protein ImpI